MVDISIIVDGSTIKTGTVVITGNVIVDPVGNTIAVAGKDGIAGTDDDLKVTGTVTIDDNGYIRVPVDGTVTDRYGNTIKDADGNDVIVPAGSIVTADGIIFLPPAGGTLDINGREITVPQGSTVYVYDPPCRLVVDPDPSADWHFPDGTYDPDLRVSFLMMALSFISLLAP